MEKIWQGHLSGKISKAAESFNASISFDKKMYKEDIEGSMVHAEMLGRYGIIEEGKAEKIISAIMAKKDAEFTCSAKDYHYLMPKTQKFHDHMLYEVKNECRFVNSMDEMTDPIMKLAVFEPGGITDESVKYWTGNFGKDCVVVTSGNEWIDFVPFGTNKAKGIREYQNRYHISPEECVTFGDEYNDIEMLKAVKYGFAMAHSKEGVRAAASYVTERVEPFLEKLIRAKGNIEEVI